MAAGAESGMARLAARPVLAVSPALHAAAAGAVVAVLLAVSQWHYLLFHMLAELFSIIVGAAMFIVAWNARHYLANGFLLFIGTAYLFISGIDLLHTLAYEGMPLFTGERFYANQLWIGARALEALSLLLAFRYLHRRPEPRAIGVWLTLYGLALLALIATIFVWPVFPVCFVRGAGQTVFKICAEYAIIALLAAAWWRLRRHRADFSPAIYRLMCGSVLATIVSELAFTVYVSNFGFANALGHIAKIASFYLIYKAIVETGLREPFTMIFRELQQQQDLLTRQNARLQELDRQKDYYLAVISHDIRSPLTYVNGGVELLEMQLAGRITDDQYRNFAIIRDGIERIARMVNDLILMARLEADRAPLARQRASLQALVERQLPAYRLAAQRRGQGVVLDAGAGSDAPVPMHEDLMSRVLDNLVGNAMKFTPPGGTVSVTLRRSAAALSCAVADSGPGIPAAQRDLIFDRFRQTGSPDLRGGVGLGLAICRDIVTRHNGTISVANGEVAGAVFTITLPLA